MEHDTIENVSYSIEKWVCFLISYIFDTSKCATIYRNIFEVYDGFLVRTIFKLWRHESRPFGPNPAQISIPVP